MKVSAATEPVWSAPVVATFLSGVQYSPPIGGFDAVSCSSVGNCTAVGGFTNSNGFGEAFTVTSTNGVWATARSVVFPSNMQNVNPESGLKYISCSGAGSCTAGGISKNPSGQDEAYLVSSSNGVWANAAPVTFPSNVQNVSPVSRITAVTCTSAGNCTAAGYFLNQSGDFDSFTVTSSNGVWATAVPIQFPANTQNATPYSEIAGLSCASAGNCAAVGTFENLAGDYEPFFVTSTNSSWGTANRVTFPVNTQNTAPGSGLNKVSCASVGNCTAVGQFKNTAGDYEAFSVISNNGVWSTATRITFPPNTQNTHPSDYLNGVACTTAGNCTAVGVFKNLSGGDEAFTVTSSNGVWSTASRITFPSNTLPSTVQVIPADISCASTGNCTVAGQFRNTSGGNSAFTATSTNGTWGVAIPAAPAANDQDPTAETYFRAVSCAAASDCTAVGRYSFTQGGQLPIAMSSNHLVVQTTTTLASTTTSTVTSSSATTTSTSVAKKALPSTGSENLETYLFLGVFITLTGFTVAATQRRRLIKHS